MSKFLTEQDILEATTYVPIATKAACARSFAEECISKVEIKLDGEVLPSMYQENPFMKSLYGMNFLLNQYFNKLEPNEEGMCTLSSADYDEWGEGNIFNAIERYKASKNKEIRDKAFDISADYREFYRMLGTEIASLLAEKNDILSRFVEFFSASITPETFSQLLSQVKEISKEIDEYAAKPKEWQKPQLSEVK
mgnify:CR=1 FL=1